jgi:hypothetical protein
MSPQQQKVVAQITIGLTADGLVLTGGRPPLLRCHFLMMLEEAKHHFLNEFYKNEPVAQKQQPVIEVAPATLLGG